MDDPWRAMSIGEWQEWQAHCKALRSRPGALIDKVELVAGRPNQLFAVMAMANDLLPNDDERKLTRERLEAVAAGAVSGDTAVVLDLIRLLDRILPPESR